MKIVVLDGFLSALLAIEENSGGTESAKLKNLYYSGIGFIELPQLLEYKNLY